LNKKLLVIKYIFQSGVGAVSNCGFSHHCSVLSDMNALRNPLHNMFQPLAASEKNETANIET